jgi:hypothetical protein
VEVTAYSLWPIEALEAGIVGPATVEIDFTTIGAINALQK